MDIVTTSAQANALEHEIAFAMSEIRRLEDAELDSMELTESLETQRTSASTESADAETLLERERHRGSGVLATAEKRLQALDIERSQLRRTIGETALAIYDRVSRSKGTGVAEGVDQKCSACQMLVRPQRWNDLRDRDNDGTLMTCESCGRLLYWDPGRDAPVKKAVAAVPAAEPAGKAEVR